MSTHLTEERIQALYDGELSGQALYAARTHVEGCVDCRRRLDLLRRLGRLIAQAAKEDEAVFAGLSDRVLEGVAKDRSKVVPLGERLRVIGRETIEQRRSILVSVALALAATLALLLVRPYLPARGHGNGPMDSHVVSIEAGVTPVVFSLGEVGSAVSTVVVWVNDEPAPSPSPPPHTPEPER